MPTFSHLYSDAANRSKRSVIRDLLEITSRPEIISFAGGLPDPNLFPVEMLNEVTHYVITHQKAEALQYSPTPGVEFLKNEIIGLWKDQGETYKSDNILITTASQQGLNLMGKAFLNKDDIVILGLPTYVGGIQAFESYGAKLIGVEVDENGMKPDKLEETLKALRLEGRDPKFLYLVPDFQNPSGATLSEERRHKIMSLSREYQLLIVEDSPYRELRFEGESPPSLKSLDSEDLVMTIRTFSKTCIPGFRIGYMIGNEGVIDKLSALKQAMDLCSASFNQFVLGEFIKRGYLKQHIQEIRVAYKKKRDLMIEALETHMPKDLPISWTLPHGGLFLWLTLPKSIDTDVLSYKCIEEEKVAFIMGSAFCCDGSGRNQARMNFSFCPEADIEEGIQRLSRFVRRHA